LHTIDSSAAELPNPSISLQELSVLLSELRKVRASNLLFTFYNELDIDWQVSFGFSKGFD